MPKGYCYHCEKIVEIESKFVAREETAYKVSEIVRFKDYDEEVTGEIRTPYQRIFHTTEYFCSECRGYAKAGWGDVLSRCSDAEKNIWLHIIALSFFSLVSVPVTLYFIAVLIDVIRGNISWVNSLIASVPLLLWIAAFKSYYAIKHYKEVYFRYTKVYRALKEEFGQEMPDYRKYRWVLLYAGTIVIAVVFFAAVIYFTFQSGTQSTAPSQWQIPTASTIAKRVNCDSEGAAIYEFRDGLSLKVHADRLFYLGVVFPPGRYLITASGKINLGDKYDKRVNVWVGPEGWQPDFISSRTSLLPTAPLGSLVAVVMHPKNPYLMPIGKSNQLTIGEKVRVCFSVNDDVVDSQNRFANFFLDNDGSFKVFVKKNPELISEPS